MRDVSLREADDVELWRHAADHDLTIVSKDSDFHLMSTMYGQPPKVVWLRIGNGPTAAGATRLLRRFSDQDLTLTDAVGLHEMQEERGVRTCWSTDRHLGPTRMSLVIDEH